MTTPERAAFDAYRERSRARRMGKRPQSEVDAEEKGRLMADALLLGVSPDEVEAVRNGYFEGVDQQEAEAAAAEATQEQLKQEAARDAAKWEGVESTIEGDSALSSFTETVDVKLDQKTGKYDGGDYAP